MRIGSVPGTNIDLVLATNTEWLFVTGRNCSDHQEAGCTNGVYDHRRTEKENIEWTSIYTTVSRRERGRKDVIVFYNKKLVTNFHIKMPKLPRLKAITYSDISSGNEMIPNIMVL